LPAAAGPRRETADGRVHCFGVAVTIVRWRPRPEQRWRPGPEGLPLACASRPPTKCSCRDRRVTACALELPRQPQRPSGAMGRRQLTDALSRPLPSLNIAAQGPLFMLNEHSIRYMPRPPPCPRCAQIMHLARKTSRLREPPDLYIFECRACGTFCTSTEHERDHPLARTRGGATRRLVDCWWPNR
jgi:hypothetical protein